MPAPELAHQAGAHHQHVRDRLGVGGRLLQGRQEIAGKARHRGAPKRIRAASAAAALTGMLGASAPRAPTAGTTARASLVRTRAAGATFLPARLFRHLVLTPNRLARQRSLVLPCLRWSRCALAAAGAGVPPRPLRPARSTRTARPGRYLLDGTWYRRSDPRDRGISARLSARARAAPAGAPVTVPNAANAGDTRRAATSAACTGTARTSSRRRRGRPTGCCASSPSTTARRSGSTAAGSAATRAATCPSSSRPGLRRRGVNRLVVRVDSRRTETAIPPLRRARRTATTSAAGGTTPASCARSTCAASTRSTSSNVYARPRLSARPAMRRIYVRAVVANMERVPGRRGARPPRSAASGSASRPRRSGRAASTCSAAARRSRTRGSGAPRTRTSTRSSWRSTLRRPGRAALHAADGHPQHRGATTTAGCC